MFSNVTKGRIRKGHASSRGYPFMFTNPAYEMSLSFTNICRLTLTTRIFINNIGRHHMWDLIFKGEQRAYSVSINKNAPLLSAFTTNHFSIKDYFHLLLKSVLFPIVILISWLALISSLYLQISLWKKQCPLQLKITSIPIVLLEILHQNCLKISSYHQ